MQPLVGLRVADFSRVLAGPYATLHLALWGAEVIRIESTRRMDMSRRGLGGRVPAHVMGQVRSAEGFVTTGFVAVNINKRSCRLDLTKAKARELGKQLIQLSDVVTENMGPGTLERLGMGYEELRSIKPDLIYVSLSGLGRTGPDSGYIAYGNSLQHVTGLTSLLGYPNGTPASPAYWADWTAGMNAVFAILAAVYHREETGEGQLIDISMLETVTPTLAEEILDYSMNRRCAQPRGNRDPRHVPQGVYRCAQDTWVAVSVTTDAQWKALCGVLGLQDPIIIEADSARRERLHDELDRRIATWAAERTAADAVEVLQGAGVPSAISYDVAGLSQDPHLRQRGFFITVPFRGGGTIEICGVPAKFALGQGTPEYRNAPTLGEHDDYVFNQLLGLDRETTAQLVSEGVIY